MQGKSAVSGVVVAITRVVRVASGVFAPGHLGELTGVVPFELVDDLLEQAQVQAPVGAVRVRDLPQRVGVYFLLAMCLFPEVGYLGVWGKLTAGLRDLREEGGVVRVAAPTAKALRDLRRRVPWQVTKSLFHTLAVPLARPGIPGAFWHRLRVVSFDGCTSTRVPDTRGLRSWLRKAKRAGYPALELMTLVETGTRGLLGAVFGPPAVGECDYARQLLPLLGEGMLVLWDKGFDSGTFLGEVAATKAMVVGRVRSNRRLPVIFRLDDGSFRSVIASGLGAVPVRVIEASVQVVCADGTTWTGYYRLITTLLDARAYPAEQIIALYHQRWEHESAYYALRHTMCDGRLLRSKDRAGVEQEMWALLSLYQILRMSMVDAVATVAGTDPDRASFTIALQTARDQVINAAGIDPDTPDLRGEIGRAVLGGLLPARRARISVRKVKSPLGRYAARPAGDERPATSQTIVALRLSIHVPSTGSGHGPAVEPPLGPEHEQHRGSTPESPNHQSPQEDSDSVPRHENDTGPDGPVSSHLAGPPARDAGTRTPPGQRTTKTGPDRALSPALDLPSIRSESIAGKLLSVPSLIAVS